MQLRTVVGKAALCLLVACTSACVEFKDEPLAHEQPAPVPAPPTEKKPLGSIQLSVSVKPDEKPNIYFVALAVQDLDSGRWIIKKQKGNESEFSILEIQPSSQSIVDTKIVAGTTYTYQLLNLDNPDNHSEIIPVKIPKDLLLDGVSTMDVKDIAVAMSGIARLFLSENAVISVLDENLAIEVEEIHANGGTIQNFADGSVAGLGRRGRSGGNITIKATRLIGSLNIIMRGERGGQGPQGATGLKGPTGGVGPTVDLNQIINSFCYNSIEITKARLGPDWEKYHPGRGLKGGPGAVGYPGFPGLQGGDTGNLNIQIGQMNEEQLRVHLIPGKAGFGGDGGDVGPGGDGGPGGAIGQNHICGGSRDCCPPPPRGPQGDPGPARGPRGPDGSAGNIGIIEINGKRIQ